jgi:hypothetical protein
MATNQFNINTNIRKAIHLYQPRSEDEAHEVVATVISLGRHAHQLSELLKVNGLDASIQIASAKQSLIVASPFWDAGTTSEMVTLARRKFASGVQAVEPAVP